MLKHSQTDRTITRRFQGTCVLVLAAWIVAGCASPNLNPKHPRTNTGYVDFSAASESELFWEVEQLETGNQFRPVFSKMKPVTDGFLRLAFSPGHYQFRITFLNMAVVEPALVDVEIQDGLVTPVLVELHQMDQSRTLSKQSNIRGSGYGRFGRRTKIVVSEAMTYRLSASAQAAQPYQLKQHMSYYRQPTE